MNLPNSSIDTVRGHGHSHMVARLSIPCALWPNRDGRPPDACNAAPAAIPLARTAMPLASTRRRADVMRLNGRSTNHYDATDNTYARIPSANASRPVGIAPEA